MQDAGGGGGGSSVGAYSSLIAAAAAKAELLHLGWDSTGDYTARREVETQGSPSDPVDYHVRIDVDTYSGEYTTLVKGPSAELARDNWVEQATGAIDKWGPKIDGLFTRWKDLPSRYTSAPLLDWAVRELNIDPDDLASTGDSAGGVNTRLAGDLERLKTRTGQLQGRYATTFADYYVNQLPTTFQAQGLLVSALAVASRAQGEIWGRTSDDLATFEYDALQAMKDSGPEGGPNSGLVLALTVVAAFGTALAAVPSLGGSVALFGAISGAAAIGAGVEAAKTADRSFEDLPLGAGHPDDVFANMEDALTALDTEITTQETGVQQFLVAAKSFADSGDCELTRPSLNSAPAGEVFSEVTVDPETIGRITELWLPSIAADLREAESRLTITSSDGFQRSTDVGLAPNGAWTEFNALQNRTSSLLTGLSTDLEDAGTKLEDAAKLIGMADEQINQHYRAVEQQVEDQNLNDPDDVLPLL
ncbi:hypothetical protein KVF89_17870 [Nocardioides carbamazepini]|uniref:hypothetical protein n=1 Tax=Nocardioides carbamazepini TaxID=2854259 RepID=UPI002149F7A3|nr:hypothetical protein [Nocardioides carbamazepini]MCR1784415.1 hypothetical protein [Nocardioides carbamazepini]